MAVVIFDCDGVLVDSELLAAGVEAELLTAEGAALSSTDVVERYVGLSDPEMHRRIEAEWRIELPDDYADRKSARLDEVFEHSLRAVEGMPELVRSLDAARCVASSSALPRLRRCLELTGLLALFEPDIFSASMVARGKPAPDLFLHAVHRLGCTPTDAVVVEDTSYGVAAAVAAGMTAIGFVGASHCTPETGDELRGVGAHHVARDAAELRALLDRTLVG